MKTRLMSLTLFASLWLTLMTTVAVDDLQASPRELGAVTEAISRSGARWTAGETTVSLLPPAERRRLLGVNPVPESPASADSSLALAADLPARLDWRDIEGVNWVTPVRDQLSCGSCWAFSAVGAMESAISLHAGNPTLSPDLSEMFLLGCSGGSCDGFWVGVTLNFLKTTGTTDEACFPYEPDDTVPCTDRCADWASRIRKVSGYSLVGNNPDAIRTALQQQPLTTTFNVYTDFYYYNGGVYEHVWGEMEGGHAVVIVGYDDVEHAWIVKNSWDGGWGDEGYFKILWGDSGIGAEAYLVGISNPCDDDEDGFADPSCGGNDCDDGDYRVYPGATESCDGKDSDCDAVLPPDEADGDSDGWPLCGDCADADPAVNPGQVELCGDGIDNDCSGAADDRDLDDDGNLDPACGGGDCDDENPATYAGAPEGCDGLDNNCDGVLPEDEQDSDGDSWLVCAGDCDAASAAVHPGRSELCSNGIDDDCDGYLDGQDSQCSGGAWAAAAPAEAAVTGSRTASGVGNAGLWILLPLAAVLAIRRWRSRGKPEAA